jgi:hypothetical protein
MRVQEVISSSKA